MNLLADTIAILILGASLGFAIGLPLAGCWWAKRYGKLQDQHLELLEKHLTLMDENMELVQTCRDLGRLARRKPLP